MVGLKTHCKLTLVVRREGKELQRYVHLATGNYNPTTSRIYTDLWNIDCGRRDSHRRHQPVQLANRFLRIRKLQLLTGRATQPQKAHHQTSSSARPLTPRAGRTGRIIAKLNSLTDLAVIRALYAASDAGVSIDLIVRGICMLKPGIPEASKNIRVRSIVGRFLEHSRLFYFGNNGKDEMFIGSADWMFRNLSRRVEVLAPIKDVRIKQFLKDSVLASYLRDNVNARELQPDGSYLRG